MDRQIPEPDALYHTLVTRYEEFADLIAQVGQMEHKLVEATCSYEAAKASYIANTDPKALGGNEEQRKAAVAQNFANELRLIGETRKTVDLLKSEAEVARIRCREVDMTVRLLALKMGTEETD